MTWGQALHIGGALIRANGLTSWTRRHALATQGASVRKPRWADGIPLISGLLMIGGGVCTIVTEIALLADLIKTRRGLHRPDKAQGD
jgi:hypothetical protein